MADLITGIQQIGIGVQDANVAKLAYKKDFGMAAKVFDDVAEATLMAEYTGNQKHQRRAILSLNMAGGGGFEIWQFLSRKGKYASKEISIGDLGIFAAKIKSRDITKSFDHFKKNKSLSAITKTIDGRKQFWVQDEFKNWFNFIESNEWFKENKFHCGGVCGAVIGVSDMDKAIQFYSNMLGISNIIYDEVHDGNNYPTSENKKYRSVLLKKEASNKGAFAKLLGNIEIELVQNLETERTAIYKNRYWGDCGFIHLCFDVLNMDLLKTKCENAGYLFTVDSNNSFGMEAASGRFCYVEDNDGTLIELVETHKVPILKKLGLYLNIKKRKSAKPLPAWMIGCMGLNKI